MLECLPWRDVVEQWDIPKTLFYLYPPYFGGESDYGNGMFGRDQFSEMAGVLSNLKGSFVLSINDVPEIRDIFKGFLMTEQRLKYTVAKDGAADAAELLVSICEPAETLL